MPTMIERLRCLFIRASPSGLMVSAALLLMACGLSDDVSVSAAPNTEAAPTVQPGDGSGSTALSLAETEMLVRSHTAMMLNVSSDQIQVVEATARTWPNHGLGCSARRGIYEPQPTPGYMIVLSHNTTTLRYHADQYGRFVRCDEVSRPRQPTR